MASELNYFNCWNEYIPQIYPKLILKCKQNRLKERNRKCLITFFIPYANAPLLDVLQ